MTDLTIRLKTEEIVLLPEKALFHPRSESLFIADLHLGKTETFQSHAIPLPAGSMEADLLRLSQALHRTDTKRLVVLGDLIHASRGRAPQMLTAFQQWRHTHSHIQMVLVRGNHDKGAGDPPVEWYIKCVDAPHRETPFVWSHLPVRHGEGYTLAGHLHPTIQLTGKGRQALKLPCFWFGEHIGILPAFTSMAASAVITPQSVDAVYLIANHEVFPLNMLSDAHQT